jgi:proteasome assembly chaperone (PAC2) family protein
MMRRIALLGWQAAELGAVAVVLAVLLHVILGAGAGDVVSGVAANTLAFLQQVPPGIVVGAAGLLLLARLLRGRIGS